MCKACFEDNRIETMTTFTVDVNGCVIVIRNVPCYECPVCGEIIFSDDVSAKLEMIVQKAKSFLQDVSVIDYSRAA
jgi:YgiT-type zinc finger domain-containing protein